MEENKEGEKPIINMPTPDELTKDVADAVNDETVAEEPERSTTISGGFVPEPKPKLEPESESTPPDQSFEELCNIKLKKEADGSLTIYKHGKAAFCSQRAERELEYYTEKSEKLVTLNQKGLAVKNFQQLPCNSHCAHFFITKQEGTFIATCGLCNEDAAYHISEDSLFEDEKPSPTFKERLDANRKGLTKI